MRPVEIGAVGLASANEHCVRLVELRAEGRGGRALSLAVVSYGALLCLVAALELRSCLLEFCFGGCEAILQSIVGAAEVAKIGRMGFSQFVDFGFVGLLQRCDGFGS